MYIGKRMGRADRLNQNSFKGKVKFQICVYYIFNFIITICFWIS